MGTGDFLGMDWQKVLPASAAAPQRQILSTHTATRSSPYFLPAQSDPQHPFNPSSATVEPWNEEIHNHAIFSSTLPFSFAQSNYPDNNSAMSLLPNLGTDDTASSSLHQCQHPYTLSVPGPPLPAHNTTNNSTVDTLMGDSSCTSGKELMGTPNTGKNSPPASRASSLCDSAAQNYQHRGRNSPIRHQIIMDQQHKPGSPPHGHSSPANPEAPERTMVFSSSGPTPPSNTSDDLRHVSIDATCTTEQLGSILQSVVGLAKSVTVKVKS